MGSLLADHETLAVSGSGDGFAHPMETTLNGITKSIQSKLIHNQEAWKK